jgi:type IV secretory pathway VirB10-like protein
MSASEPTALSNRPRPLVLGLIGAAVAVVLIYAWLAASPRSAPSNQPREPQKPVTQTTASSGSLDVRLEELKQPPPEPAGADRNPFRFYVKPPPPPPSPKPIMTAPPTPPPPQPGDPRYVAPGPPPIPLKFIGTMEQGNKRVAIFSDGRGLPLYAREGELVLGQYKIVRIGVESVVMEYADGRGRQTIPMRGQ